MSNLQKGWTEKKLGEICTITSSKRIFQKEYTKNGIPFYRTKEIKELANGKYVTTELFISEEKYKQIKDNFGIPIEGDMLLTAIGTIGEIYIVDKNKEFYFKDGNVLWLKDFQSVNTYYLKFALGSFIEEIKKLSNGSTYNALPIEKLKNHKIPLPPLEEQKRIAEILDQAEELRRKRKEAIAQLDTLTQSIFIEMFGDPVNNPKGWKTKSLRDICDEINDCPHSTPSWTKNGVICLRTSNLTKGGWNWDDTRFVSNETYHERSKRGYILPNDIILSREGTVGIAAIVTSEIKVCMGQRLVQVRPSFSVLTSEFTLQHLLYALDPTRIGKLMVGSTSQHLNVKELRDLKIPLSPLSLQKEFTQRVEAVEELKKSHRASLSELDALFASLQHRAFRGEL